MNIAKMMQQAKAMQDKMQVMQEQMGKTTVEGISGAGLVKVVMTCKGQCQSIMIDPSLVKIEEKEVMEDLLMAAINDAKGKADSKMAEETQKMMNDLGLPAGMAGNLPF